jgi:hypothetical protein
MDIERIVGDMVASAFEEDATPAGKMAVRLTPAARQQAKRFLEQSNQQHREFGGYVDGTVSGGTVAFAGFSHDVSGMGQHVTIPWTDSDETVAGWHSHPDQYEGSGLTPEVDGAGDQSPSTGDDLPGFVKAQEHGHLSVILGNSRMVVYNGRQKIHSEEL